MLFRKVIISMMKKVCRDRRLTLQRGGKWLECPYWECDLGTVLKRFYEFSILVHSINTSSSESAQHSHLVTQVCSLTSPRELPRCCASHRGAASSKRQKVLWPCAWCRKCKFNLVSVANWGGYRPCVLPHVDSGFLAGEAGSVLFPTID